VSLGAVVYVIAVFFIARSAATELLGLIRSTISRERNDAETRSHDAGLSRRSIEGNMERSISVVIPYYNGSRVIGDALASVRNQTLAPLEIVVVDDGSRPEEAAALDREARDCLVIHLPRNRGQSVARNVGIGRARGQWIAFLDCDDVWDPRKLEMQAAVAKADPTCLAVHCGVRNVSVDGQESVTPKGEITLDDLLVFPCAIFPSAVLIHRDALLECGLFDPTMGVCEDLDLFVRFCFLGNKFHSVPEPLLIRRIQPDGVSRNIAKFWSDAARVYRDYLPVFRDRRRAIGALREVYVDMAVRAVHARDFKLLWKMFGRATQRDAPISNVASRALSRVILNRFRR
jgi:glycosyltransferase involved in cell wall biosynthesis